MKILIDINHPAHVHYFRNFYKIMVDIGHQVYFVSRNKEIEHRLLRLYDIPFMDRGKGKNGKIAKFIYMIYADFTLLRIARKLDIDLFLNFLHPYPSQIASILHKVSLVFSDTEHARLHHKLTVPYASRIFTPECYTKDLGEKHIRFRGYMELAYLHPNYYKPDPSILDILHVKPEQPFVIVRFISWTAVHDIGQSGMSLDNKRRLVAELSKYASVFISAEGKLPDDLERLRIDIPFNRMHDAIFYSSLLFGESATMCSEASILGTPAIYISSIHLGYLQDQEKRYGTVHNFSETEQDEAIRKAIELIRDPTVKEKYKEKSRKLIASNIDTTAFMIGQVLKYNKSISLSTST